MYSIISRQALKKALEEDKGMILVEALPARYYKDKHLPGAINIPHDDIRDTAGALLPNRDAMIVVYCASTTCKNSGLAASELDRMGYTNVYEYIEGKEDWEAAGLPFESGMVSAA